MQPSCSPPTTGTSKLVTIQNNIIVNNVAGLDGGGISMDNASRVSIVNNTIVNNDSSATAAEAFSGCAEAVPSSRSCPQVAGVVSHGGAIGASGFRNDVVLGNRAMHVTLSTGGAYTQTVDGFADISSGLFGGGATGTDGIRNSLLSSTNVLVPTTGYCSESRANTCADPNALEPTHFVRSYWNAAPPFGFGAIAAAADEGGNFIEVHYGPLSQVYCDKSGGAEQVLPPPLTACNGTTLPGSNEELNDYHLVDGASSAINLADNASAPPTDVDSQTRQTTATATTTVMCDSTIAGCNSTFEAPVVAGDSTTDPNSWISNAVGAQTGTSRLFVDTGLQSAWTSPTGFQTQTLGAVEPNTTYTLTVRVGRRGGAGAPTYGGYTVGLYAATTAGQLRQHPRRDAVAGGYQLEFARQRRLDDRDRRLHVGWSAERIPLRPTGEWGVVTADRPHVLRQRHAQPDSVTTAANPADRGADEFVAGHSGRLRARHDTDQQPWERGANRSGRLPTRMR